MPEPGLPDYLQQAPDSAGKTAPLAQTAPQLLDFLELGWDNFERLCKRLAPDGRELHYQLYGTRGQNQQGIDIYVRLADADGYESYLCKRVQSVNARLITDAVERFLEGTW